MDIELHFLVVNDEPNLRRVLVSLLKEIGYVKISEASNGEMALRAFKSASLVGAPIEFLITDCAMPLMNGLDVIRTIRHKEETSHIPILMCTAHANQDNILSAVDAGADDYIVRPFTVASLQKKLETILSKRKMAIVDLPGSGTVRRFEKRTGS